MTDIILLFLNELFSFVLFGATVVFLQSFYDPDIKWTKKKALILGIIFTVEFTLALVLTDNVVSSTLVPCLTTLSIIVALVFDCSRRKFLKAIKILFTTSVFLFGIISIPTTVFTYVFPSRFFESLDSELEFTFIEEFSILCISLIFCGIIFLYLGLKISGKGLFIPATKKENLLMIVYLLYPYVLIFVAGYSVGYSLEERVYDYQDTFVFVMGINTILFLFLVPIFIYRNRISEFFRESNEHQRVYIEAELKHFQQYKSAQEETARFRHDIKNNLLSLNEMMSQGKTEEGKEYLRSLLGEVQSLSQKYVSGDEILDSIISSKTYDMQGLQIDFSLEGVFAGGLNLEPIDICSIFANALDNAIEANTAIDLDRYINMKLKATDKMWLIQIENPVAKNIDSKKLFNNGYTTKKDKKHHGIGTFNIKRAVEKYGGAVDVKCEDNIFTLEIILPRILQLTTE